MFAFTLRQQTQYNFFASFTLAPREGMSTSKQWWRKTGSSHGAPAGKGCAPAYEDGHNYSSWLKIKPWNIDSKIAFMVVRVVI